MTAGCSFCSEARPREAVQYDAICLAKMWYELSPSRRCARVHGIEKGLWIGEIPRVNPCRSRQNREAGLERGRGVHWWLEPECLVDARHTDPRTDLSWRLRSLEGIGYCNSAREEVGARRVLPMFIQSKTPTN